MLKKIKEKDPGNSEEITLWFAENSECKFLTAFLELCQNIPLAVSKKEQTE